MAYHIGQLRKDPRQYMWLVSQEQNPPQNATTSPQDIYGENPTYYIVEEEVLSPNNFIDSNSNNPSPLYDYAIRFKTEQQDSTHIPPKGYRVFKQNETYFLNVKIKIPTVDLGTLSFSVLLKNIDQDETMLNIKTKEATNPPQKLDDFFIHISSDGSQQYMYYSLVFTPRLDAKNLIFRYNRKITDFNTTGYSSDNWLMGQGNIESKDGANGYGIYLLNNLVTPTTWIRLGYQSRPGNLIVVNKEPIRVGRSGIFQLDKIQVDSFMIAAPKGSLWSTIDPFLLDYAYNS